MLVYQKIFPLFIVIQYFLFIVFSQSTLIGFQFTLFVLEYVLLNTKWKSHNAKEMKEFQRMFLLRVFKEVNLNRN